MVCQGLQPGSLGIAWTRRGNSCDFAQFPQISELASFEVAETLVGRRYLPQLVTRFTVYLCHSTDEDGPIQVKALDIMVVKDELARNLDALVPEGVGTVLVWTDHCVIVERRLRSAE